MLEGLVFGERASRRAGEYRALPATGRLGGAKSSRPAGRVRNLSKLKKDLRRIMEKKAGIVRCRLSLEEGQRELAGLADILDREFIQREGIEFQNMLTISQLVVDSALRREESRGAHYRSDFPEKDNRRWGRHTLVRRKS